MSDHIFSTILLCLLAGCTGAGSIDSGTRDGGSDGGADDRGIADRGEIDGGGPSDGGEASDGGETSDGAAGDFCFAQHEESDDGASVVVCDESFPSPPLVRPPSDRDEDGDSILYGGLVGDPTFGLTFAGRSMVLPIDRATPPSWLDLESGAAGHGVRYGYFVYEARVHAGAVTELRPAIRVDDRVFQRLLGGLVLEGTISPRMVVGGEVRYAFDAKSIPIRIQLDDTPRPDEHDRLSGFPRFALFGRIENANSEVQASDGSCFPSLVGFGEGDPMFAATSDRERIMILRQANMHGGFDDVFTLDWPAGVSNGNDMGAGLFVSTAALLGASSPALTEANVAPHGTPWGGPSADLTVVSGGGGGCTH